MRKRPPAVHITYPPAPDLRCPQRMLYYFKSAEEVAKGGTARGMVRHMREGS